MPTVLRPSAASSPLPSAPSDMPSSRRGSRSVLITGSSGLVGHAVHELMTLRGWTVVTLDLREQGEGQGDVLDREKLEHRMVGCSGVIHLAAVSRVAHAEAEPERCTRVNVEGTRRVLQSAASSHLHPWVIVASSREVYGEPSMSPVTEDAPLRPINAYGRSKLLAETAAQQAQREGQRAAVVRLSNVYGSVDDHLDRVIPVFVRRALAGELLPVEGRGHTFDFVHRLDVARGLAALAEQLDAGAAVPPPIQLVTGVPTTLGGLAALAVECAGTQSAIEERPPRTFDVRSFVGHPGRARRLLGWSAEVSLRRGLEALARDFRAQTASRDQ
jgi:nucleoside-diphosphate-sugar epimerase